MKSIEDHVDCRSEYFIHFPTEEIAAFFLYPFHLGHFYYQPRYHLHRDHFNSFLLMYVLEGSLNVEFDSRKWTVRKNHFILIDCYEEHSYSAETDCEVTWIHFDGPSARKMYEMSIQKMGNVFALDDPLPIINKMAQIYQPFAEHQPVNEIYLAKLLNDILTEIITHTPLQMRKAYHTSAVENVRRYIQTHIQEDLCTEELARRALMSPYHFIRVFKQETGMTPHEYIINYRIRIAELLLQRSNMGINEICYETGFSSSSVFCAAFKKHTGLTPMQYRKQFLSEG